MTVFEHLGGAREAVVCGTARFWGERRAADLNTIAHRMHRRRPARIRSRASPACPTTRSSMTAS